MPLFERAAAATPGNHLRDQLRSSKRSVRVPWDERAPGRMSLIGEEGDNQVRMAHLATVGSHPSTASPPSTLSC